MAKKSGGRYSDSERATIFADIRANGLTQVAAAKKHGISAVTLWKWRSDAKGTRRASRSRAVQPGRATNGSLDGLLRSEVRARIREMLPEIMREEVASHVQEVLGP